MRTMKIVKLFGITIVVYFFGMLNQLRVISFLMPLNHVRNHDFIRIVLFILIFLSVLFLSIYFIKKYSEISYLKIVVDKKICLEILVMTCLELILTEIYLLVKYHFFGYTESGTIVELSNHKEITSVFLYVLDICIVSPILEEMIFRAAMIGAWIRLKVSPVIAIIFSALLFTWIHNGNLFDQQIIFGLLAGVLFWKTKMIYPSIAMHVFCNIIVLATHYRFF